MDYRLVGYEAVCFGRKPSTFQRNLLSPSLQQISENTEVEISSETLVHIYHITRSHITRNRDLNILRG
jgi:hypothetical protein